VAHPTDIAVTRLAGGASRVLFGRGDEANCAHAVGRQTACPTATTPSGRSNIVLGSLVSCNGKGGENAVDGGRPERSTRAMSIVSRCDAADTP
jgi:hypothetical protein